MGEWLTTTLAGLTLLVVGWAALKLAGVVDRMDLKVDEQGERLARIEGALGNDGIIKELSKIGRLEAEVHGVRTDFRSFMSEFKDHADNEEERVLKIWRTQEEKAT